jgi:hypothetical protein
VTIKNKRFSKPAEIRNKRLTVEKKRKKKRKKKGVGGVVVIKRLEERKHERGNRLNP